MLSRIEGNHIIKGDGEMPVAILALCFILPVDSLSGTMLQARKAVFALSLEHRFTFLNFNIRRGADFLADFTTST